MSCAAGTSKATALNAKWDATCCRAPLARSRRRTASPAATLKRAGKWRDGCGGASPGGCTECATGTTGGPGRDLGRVVLSATGRFAPTTGLAACKDRPGEYRPLRASRRASCAAARLARVTAVAARPRARTSARSANTRLRRRRRPTGTPCLDCATGDTRTSAETLVQGSGTCAAGKYCPGCSAVYAAARCAVGQFKATVGVEHAVRGLRGRQGGARAGLKGCAKSSGASSSEPRQDDATTASRAAAAPCAPRAAGPAIRRRRARRRLRRRLVEGRAPGVGLDVHRVPPRPPRPERRQQASQAHCTDCAHGKFQLATGTTSCTNCATCPAGKHRLGCGLAVPARARRARTARKSGHHSWNTGCTLCGKGKFGDASASHTGETARTAPRASTATGHTDCRPCAAGRYQSETGETSCAKCPGGKFTPTTSIQNSKCKSCAVAGSSPTRKIVAQVVGQFADVQKLQAGKCAKGRFVNKKEQTDCVDCAKGHQGATGKTSARSAPRATCSGQGPERVQQVRQGHVRAVKGPLHRLRGGQVPALPGQGHVHQVPARRIPAGQEMRIACAEGRYQDARDRVLAAPPASSPRRDRAEDVGVLRACVHGQYQPLLGKTSCIECEAGKAGKHGDHGAASEAQHCTTCAAGTYAELAGATHEKSVSHCSKPDETNADHTCHDHSSTRGQRVAKCVPCPRVDGLRFWWSQAGATQCTKQPLDCKRNTWGNWGSCSKKCYPFTDEVKQSYGTAGYRFRTVTKVKQLDAAGRCGLADAAACSRLGAAARPAEHDAQDFGKCWKRTAVWKRREPDHDQRPHRPQHGRRLGGGCLVQQRLGVEGAPQVWTQREQCNDAPNGKKTAGDSCQIDCKARSWGAWTACTRMRRRLRRARAPSGCPMPSAARRAPTAASRSVCRRSSATRACRATSSSCPSARIATCTARSQPPGAQGPVRGVAQRHRRAGRAVLPQLAHRPEHVPAGFAECAAPLPAPGDHCRARPDAHPLDTTLYNPHGTFTKYRQGHWKVQPTRTASTTRTAASSTSARATAATRRTSART